MAVDEAVDEAQERRADQELLGLDVSGDGLRATVTLSEIHLSPFGRLYGGSGTSLASAVIEAAAQRRLAWVTTQFIGACGDGDRLVLRADVLAAGRQVSQVHVSAHAGSRLVFQAIGAAAEMAQDIPDGTVPAAPDVPLPGDCPVVPTPSSPRSRPGFFGIAEHRRADTGQDWSRRWWLRLPGHQLTRPALLAMAGDCVAPLVMRGIGLPGAGTSIDNTVRVGAPSSGEWVLIDGMPEQAASGLGHGHVRLWAADGTLAGAASQTTALWRSLR
jgi:acyl-CoA thioesterase